MPLTISLAAFNCGLNGSSKMADFKMTEASLMKICGKSDAESTAQKAAMPSAASQDIVSGATWPPIMTVLMVILCVTMSCTSDLVGAPGSPSLKR
jgi:hypothetical protein